MESLELSLDTSDSHLVDLSAKVHEFCRGRGDGLVHVFAPHATAGIALIELGAGSEIDLVRAMTDILPRDDRWTHRHGSRGHGADHVLPALIAPFVVLPVLGGSPALGTWQHVVFVDLNEDNPIRKVRLSFMAG
jgi:secondary thiamine-phosphate synthase enzyme